MPETAPEAPAPPRPTAPQAAARPGPVPGAQPSFGPPTLHGPLPPFQPPAPGPVSGAQPSLRPPQAPVPSPAPQHLQAPTGSLPAAHLTAQFQAVAPSPTATGAWPAPPVPVPPVPVPPPPAPRQGGARLWLTAGGAALVAAVSLVLCVALTVSTLTGDTAQASGKPHRDVLYEDSWFHTAKSIPVDVASHPFYDLPFPETVDCEIPDFDPSSAAEWETFTDTIGPCLNEMWLTPLEEMGLRPEEPHYVVLDEIPADLRGESEEEGVTLAYYLEHELSITIVVPNVRKLLSYPNMEDERIWYALVAHEYGHHVQGETGLLDAAGTLERKAGSEAEELKVGRQIELQAECLAGTGVAVLSGHDAEDVAFVNRHFNEDTGDSDTHGSAANRVYWFEAGATAETMEACNTFAADTGLVR